MRSEFTGSIASVRAVEDCIRTTKKYTKGAFRKQVQHPIQGENFPSKVLIEYYEVYPDTEVSWDMPVGVAFDWLWGDVVCIDVLFKYDYRVNKAEIEVKDGAVAVKKLVEGIPGFNLHLAEVIASNNEKAL